MVFAFASLVLAMGLVAMLKPSYKAQVLTMLSSAQLSLSETIAALGPKLTSAAADLGPKLMSATAEMGTKLRSVAADAVVLASSRAGIAVAGAFGVALVAAGAIAMGRRLWLARQSKKAA